MSFVTKVLFYFLQSFLYAKAVTRVREKGILVYLKTLQVVRRSLIGAIAVFFVLQLMALGFIGTVLVGVFLCPTDTETKLWILFGVFGTMFVLASGLLAVLLSDRVWYKVSGAREMMATQTPQDRA